MLRNERLWATLLCRFCRIAAIPSLALLLVPVAIAVEAKPDHITITTASDTVSIAVTHNGVPVPAGEISSVKLYVDDHDYDHMITVVKADGKVTITPTVDLELGMYDLAVKTSQGEVRVPVTALQEIADSGLEARAKRQGVTVEEIKAQLGISQSVGQERITLNFADAYYVGQTLKLKLDVAAGRTAVWTVNGDAVEAPGGALAYTFEQPGVYDFAYAEKQGGRPVAMGLATVSVIPEPPINVVAKVGAKQTILGPAGYTTYAWKLDGAEGGKESSWSGSFESPGKHTVTVRAASPLPETSQAFRELTYTITVQ